MKVAKGAACTDIYDREPLSERWGEGRTTLLGNAAHPMMPNLGQGSTLPRRLGDSLRSDREGHP